jgi:sensor histidine kinase YesM
MYWWEPWAISRRALFVACSVLFSDSSMKPIQYVCYVFLNLLTLSAHIRARPFLHESDNRLEFASLSILTFISILVCGFQQGKHNHTITIDFPPYFVCFLATSSWLVVSCVTGAEFPVSVQVLLSIIVITFSVCTFLYILIERCRKKFGLCMKPIKLITATFGHHAAPGEAH